MILNLKLHEHGLTFIQGFLNLLLNVQNPHGGLLHDLPDEFIGI